MCIFCQIIARKVPSYTVFESDHALAFLDIFPHAKGHTVVIPKNHHATIETLQADEVVGLFQAIQHTMARLKEVISPQGFNVGWNHGEIAGQAVSHLHVHILPRFEGDGGTSIHGIINNPGNESVEELAKKFL